MTSQPAVYCGLACEELVGKTKSKSLFENVEEIKQNMGKIQEVMKNTIESINNTIDNQNDTSEEVKQLKDNMANMQKVILKVCEAQNAIENSKKTESDEIKQLKRDILELRDVVVEMSKKIKNLEEDKTMEAKKSEETKAANVVMKDFKILRDPEKDVLMAEIVRLRAELNAANAKSSKAENTGDIFGPDGNLSFTKPSSGTGTPQMFSIRGYLSPNPSSSLFGNSSFRNSNGGHLFLNRDNLSPFQQQSNFSFGNPSGFSFSTQSNPSMFQDTTNIPIYYKNKNELQF